MTSLAALIAQVEALDEKASPQPWERPVIVNHPKEIAPSAPQQVFIWGRISDEDHGADLFKAPIHASETRQYHALENAELIAAYRSAAPVLAAALKDAIETLEKIAAHHHVTGTSARGSYEEVLALARSFLERHKEKTP